LQDWVDESTPATNFTWQSFLAKSPQITQI